MWMVVECVESVYVVCSGERKRVCLDWVDDRMFGARGGRVLSLEPG